MDDLQRQEARMLARTIRQLDKSTAEAETYGAATLRRSLQTAREDAQKRLLQVIGADPATNGEHIAEKLERAGICAVVRQQPFRVDVEGLYATA